MPCSLLGCVCGKAYLPMRFLMTIMCILGVITTYGQRVALNIAITQMVHPSSSQSKDCPFVNTTHQDKQQIQGGELPWSNSEQNYILGAFYIGYLIGHVPAGIWSDQLGARHVYSGGVLISTLVTALTPVACLNSPWWVTALLRVVMGLGQSVVYPAVSTLNARWVPPNERSISGAFSFAANSLGVVCGNLFSGMIVYGTRNWHSAFYLWALCGALWYSAFLMFIYSQPDTHPHITEREKIFLSEKLIHAAVNMKIPWKAFFKDKAIWGLMVAEIGHDFTIFTLITNMPKYMSDVLHYDIKENAVVSSIPFIGQWLSGIIAGEISDVLVAKKKVSVVVMRKINTTIGMSLPAFLVLVAGYMDCNRMMVIIFFSLNLLAKGPLYCGMKVNHLDMSVNFPGIIMAFTNGAGALSGYLSPVLIANVAKGNTLKEWHLVYTIIFGIAVITNVFYLCVATGRRRIWDVTPEEMDEFLKQEEEYKQERAEKKEAKKRAKEAKNEQR